MAAEAARVAATQALEPDAMDTCHPAEQCGFVPGSAALQCAADLVAGLDSEHALKALQAAGLQDSVVQSLHALQAELQRAATVDEGAAAPQQPRRPGSGNYGAIASGANAVPRDGPYDSGHDGKTQCFKIHDDEPVDTEAALAEKLADAQTQQQQQLHTG